MSSAEAISVALQRLESLIVPIDGGAGADVSYDEAFESLKTEVEKLTSMAGGKVDWGAIASNASDILSEKGKDFRVVIYYLAARTHTDGVYGLFEGFVVLQALVSGFWDTMGPPLKRPKARGNLCGWVAELCVPRVATYQPSSGDRDVVNALEQVSRAVDAELAEKLGEAYSGMGALRSCIANLVRGLPAEPPPPPPPPTPQDLPAESAAEDLTGGAGTSRPDLGSATPSPIESITDADSALQAVSQCNVILARAAAALREADPTDFYAYRLFRTGIWLELKASPPAEDGITHIPAPSESHRSALESLLSAGEWASVVRAGEDALVEGPLWLDPHRYVATALERLGGAFADAKHAVLSELAYLLLRVSTLPSLRFNDGTPFADDQTKVWLIAEVQPVLSNGSAGNTRSVDPLETAIDAARLQLLEGNLLEALETIRRETDAARSPLAQFRGRLASARLCLQAEHAVIARAQLEGLDKVFERHNLLDWDPDLAVEFYSALYLAHRGANALVGAEPPADARAKELAAFEQVCRLDPRAALKLTLG